MSNCIHPYPILLPKKEIDARKWAVVACDQFTSEPEYWRALSSEIGLAPSTLNMILPEVFLTDDNTARVAAINAKMQAYDAGGLFRTVEGGMIVMRRTTGYGRVRTGIVTSIDLERYSFVPGEPAAVRATEGTVLSRIPPRVMIREKATIETPHVMMLYDDEAGSVMNAVCRGEELYDFDLIGDGGHVSGWSVENPQVVAEKFESLLSPLAQVGKYGFNAQTLMAVGDGNHSLATAKTCWDAMKAELTDEQRARHPARFALVEIVNIYDPGIVFEPIHRVVTGDTQDLVGYVLEYSDSHTAVGRVVTRTGDCLYPQSSSCVAAVAGIDELLEIYGASHTVSIDYVHGESSVREIVAQTGGVGILLPALKKSELFKTVAGGGILPRKTFSMGEAREKRYYNECKRIR